MASESEKMTRKRRLRRRKQSLNMAANDDGIEPDPELRDSGSGSSCNDVEVVKDEVRKAQQETMLMVESGQMRRAEMNNRGDVIRSAPADNQFQPTADSQNTSATDILLNLNTTTSRQHGHSPLPDNLFDERLSMSPSPEPSVRPDNQLTGRGDHSLMTDAKSEKVITSTSSAPQQQKQLADRAPSNTATSSSTAPSSSATTTTAAVNSMLTRSVNLTQPRHHITRYDESVVTSRHLKLIKTAPSDQDFEEAANVELPGIADQVESYPCPFCPDETNQSLFVTPIGLQNHVIKHHPSRVDAAVDFIESVNMEWKRRDMLKEHESLLMNTVNRVAPGQTESPYKRNKRKAAAEDNDTSDSAVKTSKLRRLPNGSTVIMGSDNDDESDEPEEKFFEHKYTNSSIGSASTSTARRRRPPDVFAKCSICHIVINMAHPTAFSSHMKAHKNNDILREQLILEHGEAFVATVTCYDCNLVFVTRDALEQHVKTMHRRSKCYVCKWCASVFSNLSLLNQHKKMVHNSRFIVREPQDGIICNTPHSNTDKPNPNPAQARATVDAPIWTSCTLCSLCLTKPSLLVRHMSRVHNMHNFHATMRSKIMPNFQVSVTNGQVSWMCCNEEFSNYVALAEHRRIHVDRTGSTYRYTHNPMPNQKRNQADGSVVFPHNQLAYADSKLADDGELQQQPCDIMDTAEYDPNDMNAASGQETFVITNSDEGTDSVTLTPEQLLKLGLSVQDAANMILIDDGTGTLTAYDRNEWQQYQQQTQTACILQTALSEASLPVEND